MQGLGRLLRDDQNAAARPEKLVERRLQGLPSRGLGGQVSELRQWPDRLRPCRQGEERNREAEMEAHWGHSWTGGARCWPGDPVVSWDAGRHGT